MQFKKISTGICICSISFCLLLASVVNAASGRDPATNSKALLGYVKFPPLKTFTETVTKTFRAVQPGMQTEFMFMQFVAYGYPSFKGVSETDGFTLFILDNERTETQTYVILAKIAEDSPMLKTLVPADLKSKRFKEWVLLAPSLKILEPINDISSFIEINSLPINHSLEAKFFTHIIKRHLIELKMLALYQLGVPFGGTPAPDLKDFLFLADVIADRVSEMEWLGYHMDVSPDAINMSLELKFLKDSPEAEYFAAKSGFDVPLAQYVPAGVTVEVLSAFDNKASLKYLNFLEESLAKLSGDAEKKPLEVYLNALQEMFKDLDGTYAAAIDINKDTPYIASVRGGSLSYEGLLGICKSNYDGEGSILRRLTRIVSNKNTLYDFSIDPESFEHNGIKVIQTKMKMTLIKGGEDSEEDILEGDASPKKLLEVDKETTITEHYEYVAVVDGAYLLAARVEDMKLLIDNLKNKKVADTNVAGLISLKDNAMMQIRFNLPHYLLSMMKNVPGGLTEEEKATVETLSKESRPVLVDLYNENEKLEIAIDIPVKTMMDVSVIVGGIAQKMNEGKVAYPEVASPKDSTVPDEKKEP